LLLERKREEEEEKDKREEIGWVLVRRPSARKWLESIIS
jgi:hypothetical protein